MLRYRWVVLTAVVVAAAAGYGLFLLQATTYQAEAHLILADPRSTAVFNDLSTSSGDPARYVRNQAQYIESSTVAARVAAMLGTGISVQEIRERSSATASRDLDLVTIEATGHTPEEAATLANTLASAYIDLSSEDIRANAEATISELERAKSGLQSRADTLQAALAAEPDNAAIQAERDAVVSQIISIDTRIEQISINAALYGSGVQLFEPADLPDSPVRPRPLLGAIAAAVVALFAAALVAWWRSERSPLALDRHDPAPILRAPLLGVVPDFSDLGGTLLPTVTHRDSAAAEAYQFIASALGFAMREREANILVITSPTAKDGKTITATNLAVAAAADGRKTLLVDADERARGISSAADLAAASGLVELGTQSRIAMSRCLHNWEIADDHRLPLIPAGATRVDTPAFFRSEAFGRAMERIRSYAKENANLVVVDSPPMLTVAETSDIAARCDAVVLVVARATPLRVLEDVKERIDMAEVPLVGYVFNRAAGHGRHSYDRYYGYGRGQETHAS